MNVWFFLLALPAPGGAEVVVRVVEAAERDECQIRVRASGIFCICIFCTGKKGAAGTVNPRQARKARTHTRTRTHTQHHTSADCRHPLHSHMPQTPAPPVARHPSMWTQLPMSAGLHHRVGAGAGAWCQAAGSWDPGGRSSSGTRHQTASGPPVCGDTGGKVDVCVCVPVWMRELFQTHYPVKHSCQFEAHTACLANPKVVLCGSQWAHTLFAGQPHLPQHSRCLALHTYSTKLQHW